jgi:hypothetical protein
LGAVGSAASKETITVAMIPGTDPITTIAGGDGASGPHSHQG